MWNNINDIDVDDRNGNAKNGIIYEWEEELGT